MKAMFMNDSYKLNTIDKTEAYDNDMLGFVRPEYVNFTGIDHLLYIGRIGRYRCRF